MTVSGSVSLQIHTHSFPFLFFFKADVWCFYIMLSFLSLECGFHLLVSYFVHQPLIIECNIRFANFGGYFDNLVLSRF